MPTFKPDTNSRRGVNPHSSVFVQRAMYTYKAFEAIDKRFPQAKFAKDNAAWTQNVYTILGHETMTNEDKIDALITLIGRIRAL